MQSFNKDIMLSYGDVLGQLKFNKHLTGIDASCEEKIKEIIAQSKDLLNPQGYFDAFDIENLSDSEVLLERFGKINSVKIAELVRGCSDVVMFLVTVGGSISEEIVKSADDKNVFRALVLDAIGSVAVEQCADEINYIVTMQAKMEGLKTTRRFSTGYGDFDVMEHQPRILKNLDADKLGVTLSESGIMIPEKTVTALIGRF